MHSRPCSWLQPVHVMQAGSFRRDWHTPAHPEVQLICGIHASQHPCLVQVHTLQVWQAWVSMMLAATSLLMQQAHPMQAALGISRDAAALQRHMPPGKMGPEATVQRQLPPHSLARSRQAAGRHVAHLWVSAVRSKLLRKRVNTLKLPGCVLRTCKLVKGRLPE